MDISPRGLLRNWVPTLPSQIKTAILSALGKSENSDEQDWVVELTVNAARPILQTPASLLKSQEYFRYDPGVYGHVWVATYTVPAPRSFPQQPETDDLLTIHQSVQFAIQKLSRSAGEKSEIPPFHQSGIEAEWTSHRKKAYPWTRPPRGATQRQIYDAALLETPDRDDSPVILYAHGGAFCLMDPANHRINAVDMATSTNARLLSVRYRLSPQAIFPAALLDMFLCYLALLSPPPGAFHKAVSADKIILAGDSSGGNLVTALQVLLITLVQDGKAIYNPWTEGIIEIPIRPNAALSLSSPWLDITRSLPSQIYNSRWDFIAPASVLSTDLISTSPLFPADEIWPSKPVRTETYCDAILCAHPLVSPLIAPNDILKDFPSAYICTGWEGMTDESQVFARRMQQAKQKGSALSEAILQPAKTSTDSGYASISGSPQLRPVDVHCTMEAATELMFDGYTGMPHTFTIIPHRTSTVAKRNRAEHMKRALTGQPRIDSATWTRSRTMKCDTVNFSDLGSKKDKLSGYSRTVSLTDDLVCQLVDHGRTFRVELEKKLRKHESIAFSSSNKQPSMGMLGIWNVVFYIRDVIFAITYRILWKSMQS